MGTRICVKGLPRHADEATLRTHFANIGSGNGTGGGGGGRGNSTSKVIITDAKVVRTPDGRSRQFGFVGFRSHEDALRALEYFDRSFMGAARLSVEWASGVGGGGSERGDGGGDEAGAAFAAPPSRPWSKYTKAKLAADAAQLRANEEQQQLPPPPPLAGGNGGKGSAAAAAAAAAEKSPATKRAEDDPRFAEFLSLMAPRSAVPLWANDDGTAAAAGAATGSSAAANQPSTPAPKKGREKKGGDGGGDDDDDDDDDDELYEELPAPKGAAAAGEGGESDDDEERPVPPLSDPAVADAAVSDLDYLKRRVVSEISSDDDGDDEKEAGGSSSSDDDGDDSDDEDDGNDDALPPPPPLEGQEDEAAAMTAAGQERHPNNNSGLDLESALAACRGRLFLRNLPFTATEDEVRALFEEHRDAELWGGGRVESVHVVLDRVSRQSRGIALVQLSAAAAAAAAASSPSGEGSRAAAAADAALTSAASAALRALDGSIFQGRLLHVMPARPAPEHEKEGGADSGAEGGGAGNGAETFKAAREAARRAAAGGAGDARAWNSLFMRQDTVAAAVAAHYGVSKGDLLSRDAEDSPAVRMALGEAHVIAATKAALASAGVDVGRLEASAAAAGSGRGKDKAAPSPPAATVKRSSTALLIKNLPYATTEHELRSLLAPFGPLKRLVLPPTRAVALCEFQAPPDARSALRGLAYRRLHHVPLYLEWAPFGVFAEDAPTLMDQQQGSEKEGREGTAAVAAAAAAPEISEAATTKKQRKAEAVAATLQTTSPGAEEDAAADTATDATASTRTLFVKNLAWATDDAHLREHFERLLRSVKLPATALRSARVARKKKSGASSSESSLLSAGFGFVELESEEAAAAVLRACSRGARGGAPPPPRLDGHALVVEPAAAGNGPTASASAAARTKRDDVRTKLAVLNVAFQATRGDLVSLFSPFGAVKSCRVPKKAAALDGSHRGYAFVDFASHGEARAALLGLAGTHLYGRRLALQWAEEDAPDAAAPGGLDALTERSARRSRAATAIGEDGGGRSAKRLRGNEFQIE